MLAFSAFNHPVNLFVPQVAPAVAAGAPFIVKPAAATPLSCMRLVSILHEAGLPRERGQALVTRDTVPGRSRIWEEFQAQRQDRTEKLVRLAQA